MASETAHTTHALGLLHLFALAALPATRDAPARVLSSYSARAAPLAFVALAVAGVVATDDLVTLFAPPVVDPTVVATPAAVDVAVLALVIAAATAAATALATATDSGRTLESPC